jgi:uncharacterized protein YjbK
MAGQEIELKWALTEDAWHRLGRALRARLGPPRRLDQRNRFFDSADLRLRRAGLNLRLRDENGRTLLTCKRRVSQIGGLHHHEEWESWLDDPPPGVPEAARLPVPPIILATLADAPLVTMGGFANQRDEFHHGDELLCLDRTDFGVRIDHELEIETSTPDATAEHWSAQLATWGIAYAPQPSTKFARMLQLSQS